jgi:3-hydroxyacyl-CoA dehydrogenase
VGDWTPNLRRILIDLIEEYARHVGHADLIRESVDGLTGEDPGLTSGPPCLTDTTQVRGVCT